MSTSPKLPPSPRVSRRTLFGGVGLAGVVIAACVGLPELRRSLRGESAAATATGSDPEDVDVDLNLDVDVEPMWHVADGASATSAHDPAGNGESQGSFRSATIGGAATIAALPLDLQSVEDLHTQSLAGRCDVLPAGAPVRISEFHSPTNENDIPDRNSQPTALSSRRHVMSVGLDMLADDRGDLPLLSKGQILEHLASEYITIQVRLQKDPITGELFLHRRPIAAMVPLPAGSLTTSMSEELVETLQFYRGVGLFLPEGETATAANLRTLVLLHRSDRPDPGSSVLRPHLEYLFVHARPKNSRADSGLDLHVFATSNERAVLHWLHKDASPRSVADCALVTYIYFTEYTHGGLYPGGSLTRQTRLDARASYRVDDLAKFSAERGWGEGAFDRLPALLDAIVSGEAAPLNVQAAPTAAGSVN